MNKSMSRNSDGCPMGAYMNMFKDYNQFIIDLEMAINDEAEAAAFYTRLMEIAPCEEAREFIRHARDDEREHFRMFSDLFTALTGRQPLVRQPVVNTPEFCEGVKEALKGELEAAHLYRDMYLSTSSSHIRDILFEAMTDEMEHATRFNFVYAASDCHEAACEIRD